MMGMDLDELSEAARAIRAVPGLVIRGPAIVVEAFLGDGTIVTDWARPEHVAATRAVPGADRLGVRFMAMLCHEPRRGDAP